MLKQLALTGVLAIITSFSKAQVTKGDIMAGGSLGFQYKTVPYGSYSDFQISVAPRLGFFASKHFVAGPQIVVSYEELKQANKAFQSVFFFGIGPFLRYYGKIGEKAYLFGHAAPFIGVSSERFSTDKTQPYFKIFQLQWELGPGIAFMLNKNVALEPSIYYRGTYRNTAIANTPAPSNAVVEHGFVFNLGFQVFLSKTKTTTK